MREEEEDKEKRGGGERGERERGVRDGVRENGIREKLDFAAPYMQASADRAVRNNLLWILSYSCLSGGLAPIRHCCYW